MATKKQETEDIQKTIDELKERLDRLEKENANLKGETSWEPAHGEQYYAVDAGSISDYMNFRQDQTNEAVAVGNCFKTKAEAEGFLEWLKARKTLLDDTNGFKPDWEDTCQGKTYVFYDAESKGFFTAECASTNDGKNIWFETGEDAEESIEKHKKEWKIYFGIDD